ncbi:MAG: hypothetical protein ACREQV_19525, partial [Candidatus Binatia bacterium]
MNVFVPSTKHSAKQRSQMSPDSGASEGARARVLLSQRRLRMLRALAEKSIQPRTAEEACAAAAATIAENAHDLPFALIYLLDDDNRRARLAGATGWRAGDPAAPGIIELDNPANVWWPLRKTIET